MRPETHRESPMEKKLKSEKGLVTKGLTKSQITGRTKETETGESVDIGPNTTQGVDGRCARIGSPKVQNEPTNESSRTLSRAADRPRRPVSGERVHADSGGTPNVGHGQRTVQQRENGHLTTEMTPKAVIEDRDTQAEFNEVTRHQPAPVTSGTVTERRTTKAAPHRENGDRTTKVTPIENITQQTEQDNRKNENKETRTITERNKGIKDREKISGGDKMKGDIREKPKQGADGKKRLQKDGLCDVGTEKGGLVRSFTVRDEERNTIEEDKRHQEARIKQRRRDDTVLCNWSYKKAVKNDNQEELERKNEIKKIRKVQETWKQEMNRRNKEEELRKRQERAKDRDARTEERRRKRDIVAQDYNRNGKSRNVTEED